MPRKKATTKKDEVSKAAPKRTRKAAPKRVAAKAANASATERPRILSSEEKRQLILAHAAERQPVDGVQRLSLWSGVVVCILAIAIGWVYTMRQSIASAIDTSKANSSEQIDYGELKESMHSNINRMVEQIDTLQEDHILELKEQAEIIKSINEAAQSTSTEAATSTDNGGKELFQPNNSDNQQDDNFSLPPGVSIDTTN